MRRFVPADERHAAYYRGTCHATGNRRYYMVYTIDDIYVIIEGRNEVLPSTIGEVWLTDWAGDGLDRVPKSETPFNRDTLGIVTFDEAGKRVGHQSFP